MARYNNIDTSGEEFFLRPISENDEPIKQKSTQSFTAPTVQKQVKIEKNMGFEASVNSFSSKDAARGKTKRKKKRKLGVNGVIRLIAICVCIGIFTFSLFKIGERVKSQSVARKVYESLNDITSTSVVSHPKQVRRVTASKDLLTFLGSDTDGIEYLDTQTQNYYETLRDKVIATKAEYPNCIGWITVSGTNIDYPLMKTYNNDYYLKRLSDGTPDAHGSIFADYRLSDDFDKNMNTVIYGHCMTDGTMFRGIKLFFDSEYRYSKAQELEITIVTEEGVYIYEYFSGYRSEGSHFISRYEDNGTNTGYYSFLKKIRAKNTIPKNVGYNANSKIVTLVTCTNLASKPDERYVLHGILANHFTFE